MKEITEDYVSFETAKLLKAKGFNEKCFRTYFNDGIISRIFDDKDEIYNENLLPSIVTAPTLQMAMKWLREIHGVFISICNGNHKTDNGDTSTPDNVYYFFVITDARAVYEEEKQCLKEFSSYEEACEAAIKYCLENLI